MVLLPLPSGGCGAANDGAVGVIRDREILESQTFRPINPLSTLPHDFYAFTEGLVYLGGQLVESTGELGQSSMRTIGAQTGRTLSTVYLPTDMFGEGITALGSRLIQGTLDSGMFLVWQEPATPAFDTVSTETNVWGITADAQRHLIISNGTSDLLFLDADDFRLVRTLRVEIGESPLNSINELEWVNGEIWANILPTDRVVRIDPSSGKVLGILRVIPTVPVLPADWAPANGIAFDEQSGRLFFTGKRWPQIIVTTLGAICAGVTDTGLACKS